MPEFFSIGDRVAVNNRDWQGDRSDLNRTRDENPSDSNEWRDSMTQLIVINDRPMDGAMSA
jgi:hypothetical protein